MQWALVENKKTKAYPGLNGYCCSCAASVVPKCGELREWHWAHQTDHDCDVWGEHETRWHIDWKDQFPKDFQEVKVGPHRADIKLPSHVIELQHSSISSFEISERENFYKDMVWLIDGAPFQNNFVFWNKGDYWTFRWKWPHTSWSVASLPILVDFGDYLFFFKSIYWGSKCSGWGRKVSPQTFTRGSGGFLREKISYSN
ncbi:MAG: competence protein CoiA family protein [Aliarcobacter sp.]